MFADSVDAGTANPRNAMKKVLYFQCKSSQLKHTSSSILMVQGRLQITQKHGRKARVPHWKGILSTQYQYNRFANCRYRSSHELGKKETTDK
jgi:hypothetical protein